MSFTLNKDVVVFTGEEVEMVNEMDVKFLIQAIFKFGAKTL